MSFQCLINILLLKFLFYSYNIYITNILTILLIFFQFQIEKDDGFPVNICHICVSKLLAAYNFQQICENAYKTLCNYINKKPNECSLIVNDKNYITQNDDQIVDETKETIYACPDCTLCFTEKDDLKVHSQDHNNKFVCEVVYLF